MTDPQETLASPVSGDDSFDEKTEYKQTSDPLYATGTLEKHASQGASSGEQLFNSQTYFA